MKDYPNDKPGIDRILLYIIGGLTIFAVVLIVIFSINEKKQIKENGNIISYTSTDQEKPKVNVSSSFVDLGSMKVKDEKTAEFIIENKGAKPLQIFKISSSCDCTFGQVTINGEKSPEFGMHSKNTWVGMIESGKNAKLSVIYRPFIMPVKGVVTRDVYVQTNDPANQQLTFTLKAFVE